MSLLSIGCIAVGLCYLVTRMPAAISPQKTVKYYRLVFSSKASTYVFTLCWFIPWSIVCYFTYHLTDELAKLLFVWSAIGIMISIYIFIFPERYRLNTITRIDRLASDDGHPLLRILCFTTTLAGAFLIYAGIYVY